MGNQPPGTNPSGARFDCEVLARAFSVYAYRNAVVDHYLGVPEGGGLGTYPDGAVRILMFRGPWGSFPLAIEDECRTLQTKYGHLPRVGAQANIHRLLYLLRTDLPIILGNQKNEDVFRVKRITEAVGGESLSIGELSEAIFDFSRNAIRMRAGSGSLAGPEPRTT